MTTIPARAFLPEVDPAIAAVSEGGELYLLYVEIAGTARRHSLTHEGASAGLILVQDLDRALGVILSLFIVVQDILENDPSVVDDEDGFALQIADRLSLRINMSRSSVYKWLEHVGVKSTRLISARYLDDLIRQNRLLIEITKELKRIYNNVLNDSDLAMIDETLSLSSPRKKTPSRARKPSRPR